MATKKRQKQLIKGRLDKAKRAKKAADEAPLLHIPGDATQDIPRVDYPAMLRAIAAEDPRVWDAFIQYMGFFERHHYSQFGLNSIKSLNEYVQCVFTALGKETFVPSRAQASILVRLVHVFGHLVASSCFKDTTHVLDSVLPMQGNVPKILFLTNPRCKIQMDQSKLFDADPQLASLWFQSYLLGISTPTDEIQKNVYRHLENMDERWAPANHIVSGLYFGCTYHNPECVRRIKTIINKGIKSRGMPEITNTPKGTGKKHIAIVTNRWHRNHAVYKSASPLVEQLIGEYEMTLIWTGRPDALPETVVKDYFDDVMFCYFNPDGSLVMPDGMKDNDFDMVYYPDIGMSDESIWMSNMRLAPIQAVGYGHPDTTGYANEIDYFVGGQVEKDAVDAFYSETMVLLPGLAQEPAWPTAPRQNNYKDDGIVRVNCVWGPDKYNFTLLNVLAEINKTVDQQLEKGTKPTHEFHLFASPGVNRYAALPSFSQEIARLLPNAIIHSTQEYHAYMENAEEHDFSLNSFPFGCYNVLIESLYMGLPFLTIVGDRFYNRAGMWLNDQIGMPENNFDSPRNFVNKAADLITQPDELKRQRVLLASLDLKDRLFTLKGKHFLSAVNYMFANHPFHETKLIGDDE